MSTVQSVARSIALLEEAARRPRGLVGLADAVDLPTTTAARLLATLTDLRVLHRDDDGVYRIGPTITSLAASVDLEPSLRALAQPYMAELVAAVDEAVGLSICVDDHMVTVAQVDAPRAVQAEDWFGTRWPLLGGSSGYALLATWSDDEVEQALRGVEHPDCARSGIERACRTGVAWSHGDYVAELSSVAAPITDANGRGFAVLYIYGPSYRFPQPTAVGPVEELLRGVAGRISRAWVARTPGRRSDV